MAGLGIFKPSRPALRAQPSTHSMHCECSFPGVKWLGAHLTANLHMVQNLRVTVLILLLCLYSSIACYLMTLEFSYIKKKISGN